MISSAIPSQKYSFSGSELMFWKGSTAMLFCFFFAAVGRSSGAGMASPSSSTARTASGCLTFLR